MIVVVAARWLPLWTVHLDCLSVCFSPSLTLSTVFRLIIEAESEKL